MTNFKQTCDKPYDRHHYKIVCQNKSFVVESWEQVKDGGGIIVIYQNLMQLYMH